MRREVSALPRVWLILLWLGVHAACAPTLAQLSQSSAESEIDAGSVRRLTLRLMQPTGQRGGHAGAAVVAGGRLFVVTPFPHSVLALDLAHPDTPTVWRYKPHADGIAMGLASSRITTGGVTLSAGRLFLNTFDGHTLALAAETGSVLWDTVMTETARGETLQAAPLVVDDRVYIGNDGGDFGVRGWIAALDGYTGRLLWKRYDVGPDTDVGIGPELESRYLIGDAADRGVASWPPDAWQQGGGDLAGSPLYDRASGLLIHATGHPAPWNANQRPGANYFTSGIFGRDAITGAVRWFVPINPHDLYGLGAEGSLIPVNLRWQGSDRRVLLHPDANGMVYVLDRTSGEILSVHAFEAVNATEGVDVASGTLRRNPAKATQVNATTRDICPGWPGATGRTAQAGFSPQTGLLYIPVNRLCMDMEARHVSFVPGTPYIGSNMRAKAGHGDKGRGALIAWDVIAGRPVWRIEESYPVQSGVLAIAGGVVFYGTLDGWFKAVDANNGKPLWQFRSVSGIISQPISFQRDGRQYIVVMAGVGGPVGAVAEEDVDLRDATAAYGYANAIRDLKPSVESSGMVYVFGLP